MNIALILAAATRAPLQSLASRWLRRQACPQAGKASGPPRHEIARTALEILPIPTRGTEIAPPHAMHRRPLRVVRVAETGQHPMGVGRMVISGRMADVCAELDRLAASETDYCR